MLEWKQLVIAVWCRCSGGVVSVQRCGIGAAAVWCRCGVGAAAVWCGVGAAAVWCRCSGGVVSVWYRCSGMVFTWCEYEAGEDRWSSAGFSGRRSGREIWRTSSDSADMLVSSAARAPSRCHARPRPPRPCTEPSGGLITAAGPQRMEG